MGSFISRLSPRSPPSYLSDDMLCEIMLRLPPHPSYLRRVSLVSKHFRRLVNDQAFLRQFRAHHGENPPLLGFFHNEEGIPGRFLPVNNHGVVVAAAAATAAAAAEFEPREKDWTVLDSRHGLVLLQSPERFNFLVWDPMTRRQEYVPAPLEYHVDYFFSNAAVVSTGDGDDDGERPFQIVFVTFEEDQRSISVSVYSSEEECWSLAASSMAPAVIDQEAPSVLVGDVLYWTLLVEANHTVLAFSLDTYEVSEMSKQHDREEFGDGSLLVMDDSRLGVAAVRKNSMSLHLWALDDAADAAAAAQWSLRRVVDLDVQLPVSASPVHVLGHDEEGREAFLQTDAAVYSMKLQEPLEVKKLFDRTMFEPIYPYKRFYVKGLQDLHLRRVIQGGADEEGTSHCTSS